MARTSGTAGSGGRSTVFSQAAYTTPKAAVPGGFRSAEEVASQEQDAYDSGYVQTNGLFAGRGVFDGLPSQPANNPQPKSGQFFEASIIANTEYLSTDTPEELEAKAAALRSLGLNPNTDFALRYYNPVEQDSVLYENRDTANFTAQARKAAGLTDIPTSSTNFRRPRTVAAGWEENSADDPVNGTLTVVFRDGTPYNFYDVPRSVWIKFHNSISKGRPFLNPKNSRQSFDGTLLAYQHGPADVSSMSEEMRELVYQSARTQQIYHRDKSGKGHYQYQQRKRATTAGGNAKTRGNKAASGRVLAQSSDVATGKVTSRTSYRVKTTGTAQNPNKNNGKNPYQK